MATSVQHPQRSLHLRPTSRLTWVGLGLLLVSVASFVFSVASWDALITLLGPDTASAVRGIVATVGIWLAGVLAPVVIVVATIWRRERSLGSIAGFVVAVLWIMFLRAMTTG